MTNTEQLIVLSTNNVPTASQNTLNIVACDGMTIESQANGAATFSLTDGITPGSLFPYCGVPIGTIPGSAFTVPFELVAATVTVFVNGLALLPTAYTQDGVTFILTAPLETGETIAISGFYQAE